MYKYVASILCVFFVACAGPKGDIGVPGPAGAPVVVVIPSPAPSPISVIVSEYNDQRVASGSDPVTQGLDCTLYTVPGTTTAIVGATLTNIGSWTYVGIFNDANGSSTTGLSVIPASIRSLYTSYYVVKCTGLLVVPSSGFYDFQLSSDDGANLYVSGLLINNDGTHSVTTKSATKYLNRGVVSFELDYFDIGGSKALVLNSNGSPLPAANLYH